MVAVDDLLTNWQALGDEVRYWVSVCDNDKAEIQYVPQPKERQSWAKFSDKFDPKSAQIGAFAFEVGYQDEDKLYKGVLIVWSGPEASDGAKRTLDSAVQAFTAGTEQLKIPADHIVKASSKADLEYCKILDAVSPPMQGDEDEGGYDDGGYKEGDAEVPPDDLEKDDGQ
eukprot:TRINITY_DN94656_c0_g1_i1.p1 TRINITY_DN94656_c0_g1~~TRINITY_DN94656_c0_g1_i1.p1  ORF type:complete len:170 (+),score=26.94 TRINITY_DN94656_c0_g1_i1:56-565(+)